jgi:hypothetical protein
LSDFVPADHRANYLPGGDMEDLDALLHAGWRHYRRELPGAATHVELSLDGPHSGRYALRLVAQQNAAGEASTQPIESPPVWIRSAEVAVPRDTHFVVRGWVRIDKPLAGSAAAMLIYDSHGGPELAHHVSQTSGWQPFALWRAATRDEPVTINFELNGWGEAQVDDLEILKLNAPLPPPVDTMTPPSSTARRLRDLFGPPR